MTVEKKLILDIDSPTHIQTKRAIDNYRQSKRTGLFTPDFCGGCSQTMSEISKTLYFGEFFCRECVEKWIQGHK